MIKQIKKEDLLLNNALRGFPNVENLRQCRFGGRIMCGDVESREAIGQDTHSSGVGGKAPLGPIIVVVAGVDATVESGHGHGGG